MGGPPMVFVLWLELGATGRRIRKPVRVGSRKAQVSEYRDLWHPINDE